jgi:hypothetical protein
LIASSLNAKTRSVITKSVSPLKPFACTLVRISEIKYCLFIKEYIRLNVLKYAVVKRSIMSCVRLGNIILAFPVALVA